MAGDGGFDVLRRFLKTPEGHDSFLYPALQIGDVWWIPDSVTRLPKVRHPWVIVEGYTVGSAAVVACIRTSTFTAVQTRQGILTPANVIPDLDREGLINMRSRRSFTADSFENYVYIGRLPDEWIVRMTDFYRVTQNVFSRHG